MNNKEDLSRVARLESRLDYVESELQYLHQLLINCGFPEGVETLKATIEELLEEAENPYYFPPDDRPEAYS